MIATLNYAKKKKKMNVNIYIGLKLSEKYFTSCITSFTAVVNLEDQFCNSDKMLVKISGYYDFKSDDNIRYVLTISDMYVK